MRLFCSHGKAVPIKRQMLRLVGKALVYPLVELTIALNALNDILAEQNLQVHCYQVYKPAEVT